MFTLINKQWARAVWIVILSKIAEVLIIASPAQVRFAFVKNFNQIFLRLQVRRGSEPSLHKPSSDNIVTTASGSVQAVIASINARTSSSASSTSNTVSRSLSSHEMQQHLRSSLRKTMVNTQFGYFDNNLQHDDRAMQQSSPDSQYGEGDAGSLSVMRRREPLGASGNKPERPK